MDLYTFVKIIYIHKYFFSEVGLGRRLRWIICTVYPYNITVTVYIVHNYNNNNNNNYYNIHYTVYIHTPVPHILFHY